MDSPKKRGSFCPGAPSRLHRVSLINVHDFQPALKLRVVVCTIKKLVKRQFTVLRTCGGFRGSGALTANGRTYKKEREGGRGRVCVIL